MHGCSDCLQYRDMECPGDPECRGQPCSFWMPVPPALASGSGKGEGKEA